MSTNRCMQSLTKKFFIKGVINNLIDVLLNEYRNTPTATQSLTIDQSPCGKRRSRCWVGSCLCFGNGLFSLEFKYSPPYFLPHHIVAKCEHYKWVGLTFRWKVYKLQPSHSHRPTAYVIWIAYLPSYYVLLNVIWSNHRFK